MERLAGTDKGINRMRKEKFLFLAGGAAVFLIVAAVLLLALRFPEASAAAEPVVYPKTPPFQERDDEAVQARAALPEETVEAVRSFSVKASERVLTNEPGENAIFSPVSLWYALAMGAECTGGETRAELLTALEIPAVPQLRTDAPLLFRALYTDNEAGKLRLANSLWMNRDISFHKEVQDILREDYYAFLSPADFESGAASGEIAGWVRENTGGLLGGDAGNFPVDAGTLAMILNTVWFKDGWANPFLESRTEDGIFSTPEKTVSASFLQGAHMGRILLEEDYRMASLRFQNGAEMKFVLPEGENTPESLLEGGRLPEILEGGAEEKRRSGEIEYRIPKFDFESGFELNDVVKSLGAGRIFSGEADFSPLTGQPAYVSLIRQQAKIAVDEKGCEAAAVTTVMVEGISARLEEPERFPMNLDRPFLFVIEKDGVPLFTGIVNDPMAE